MSRNLGSGSHVVSLLWIMAAVLLFPFSNVSAQSPQDDAGWSQPVVLVDEPGFINDPQVVADRTGRLHVFWRLVHEFSGNQAIYYLRSDPILNVNSTANPRWTEPVLLQLRKQLGPPSAVVDDAGTIHLVFQSTDRVLWYTHVAVDQAIDQGSWSTPVRVGRGQAGAQIALGPDHTLYLVYGSANSEGVLLQTSSDGGNSWSGAQVISLPYKSPDRVDDVRIAVESSQVLHVAWSEFTRSSNRPAGVYYTRSVDGGKNWSEAYQLAGSGFTQVNLAYSPSTGELHTAWNGAGSAKGRYYRRSMDGGTLWQDVEDISPDGAGGSDGLPQLVVDAKGTLSLLTGEAGCAWYLQRQTAWETPFCFSKAEMIAQPGLALLNGRQLAAVFQEQNQSFYRLSFALRLVDAPGIAAQPFDRLVAIYLPSETPPPAPSATPEFTPAAPVQQTPAALPTRSASMTPSPAALSTPVGTALSQDGAAQLTPSAPAGNTSPGSPVPTFSIPNTGSANPQPLDTSQIILISLAPTLVGLLILIGSRILRRNRPDY